MKRSLFTLTLLCVCLGGLVIVWRLSGATPLAAQPAPPSDSGPSVVDEQSAYLPVLVRNEDHALLMGAIVLFAALAAVMWLTRRTNWHALGRDADATAA